jgi:hypothetical protein
MECLSAIVENGNPEIGYEEEGFDSGGVVAEG